MVSPKRAGGFQQLRDDMKKHSELVEMFRSDPQGAMETFAKYEPIPNTFVYGVVVTSLGAAVILALVGAMLLVLNDKTPPDIAVAIGSAAVGALAGLLAPSPR